MVEKIIILKNNFTQFIQNVNFLLCNVLADFFLVKCCVICYYTILILVNCHVLKLKTE